MDVLVIMKLVPVVNGKDDNYTTVYMHTCITYFSIFAVVNNLLPNNITFMTETGIVYHARVDVY